MTDPKQRDQDIRAFWNGRAGLGMGAGTQDEVLKKLEIEALATYFDDGMRVLDVGCGNGITAIEIARRYNVDLLGLDFAEEMVAAATAAAAKQQIKGSVRFQTGDVRNLSDLTEKFDRIYTERTLINLPDWPTQKDAIRAITSSLGDDGMYLMCENSQNGLDNINLFRERLELSKITPPWHNRYLNDSEVEQAVFPGVKLERVVDFSSTYYFLSRIANAWLAGQGGKEPDYESSVNKLALNLPSVGHLGQCRIWLWRKIG